MAKAFMFKIMSKTLKICRINFTIRILHVFKENTVTIGDEEVVARI